MRAHHPKTSATQNHNNSPTTPLPWGLRAAELPTWRAPHHQPLSAAEGADPRRGPGDLIPSSGAGMAPCPRMRRYSTQGKVVEASLTLSEGQYGHLGPWAELAAPRDKISRSSRAPEGHQPALRPGSVHLSSAIKVLRGWRSGPWSVGVWCRVTLGCSGDRVPAEFASSQMQTCFRSKLWTHQSTHEPGVGAEKML